MFRLRLIVAACLAVVPLAMADEALDKAPKPIVLTEKDHGKTVEVKVGQAIEVQLTNAKAGAGWEPGGSELRGESVARANLKRTGNCDEFLPADKCEPKTTVGTYVFRYVAAEPGASVVRLTHLFPSGPLPIRRTATQFIAECKITIDVKGE